MDTLRGRSTSYWYKAWQEGGMAQRPKTYYIQAHVVHVEMISQQEMGFKLTPETIQSLIEMYDDTISRHMTSSNCTGPEKEATPQSKERQQLVQRVNGSVFRTHISALETLKSDGTGTLIGIQANAAREAVESLLAYITPPHQDDKLLPTQGSWKMNRQEDPLLKDVRLEDTLSEMTTPCTVHPDQIFSPGQLSSCLIPFPQHGQQYLSTYAQSLSLYSQLQWPSAMTEDA
ncbi:hypothetical protein N7490_006255 [Penicillium lividum]|nr:hypothetical protein N7490_006255 [Penicillium lividum]